jgi:ATP-dependent DNA helicase RecQ
MSCTASALSKVAKMRNSDPQQLERIIGARHSERFGAAFLDVIANAQS